MTPATRTALSIRSARETDLDDIDEMLNDFVKGHPAESHSRSRSKLREAYFGATPVGTLLMAERGERVIFSGLAPRDSIRRLPEPGVNTVAARARG
jgi:hypothetical protein